MTNQIGIKILVCGIENSGKTRLTSQIKDAFIINLDDKKYKIKVPHTNINDFVNINDLKKKVAKSINKYEDKFKKKPKVLVFDTVTQMYTEINKKAMKFTGWEVHSYIKDQTLLFNEYINSILEFGIDVVIVAHAQIDKATGKWKIPATGSFADAGSWLSVVDEAIFLEVLEDERVVHRRTLGLPCRTLLPEVPESESLAHFDINKYINDVRSNDKDVSSVEF